MKRKIISAIMATLMLFTFAAFTGCSASPTRLSDISIAGVKENLEASGKNPEVADKITIDTVYDGKMLLWSDDSDFIVMLEYEDSSEFADKIEPFFANFNPDDLVIESTYAYCGSTKALEMAGIK